jgi:pyruvate dehydrogenase E2 component (dihydrolipoamide acetyltransferase)
MALLQPSGVSLDTKKEKEAVPLQPTEEKTIKSTLMSTAEIRKIKVSPLARRIAEENHIKLESVKGTGPDGAITKEDVDHVIAKTEKLNPKNQCSSSSDSVSNSRCDEQVQQRDPALLFKIDLTKALAWLGNQ